jgi:hypothetical protein
MHRTQIFALTLLLGSATSGPIGAQTPDAESAIDTPRQYTLEMIVFEYADSNYDGNEIFVADAVEIPEEDIAEDGLVFSDIPQVTDLAPDASKPTIEEVPAIRRLDLRLLEPAQYTMGDIYSKLEKLDAYRPILHTGWTQTTVERDLTAPVRLRMLGNVPLKLDGDLTLYLSRYLHLVVNLQMDAVSLQPVQSYSPQDSSWSDKPDLRPAPVRYSIFEDRIFKSGELRYFDHPKFGVLVRITRHESTENDTDPGGRSLSAE